jgi:hypothetical protein
MIHFEWQILVIALVSEILGTASGLGSSVLFLPLAQYVEPPHLVMVLTAILHVFANSFRVYLFWAPQGYALLKKLAPTFLVTTGIGALLAIWTTPPYYKLAMGSVLIIFGALRLFSKQHQTMSSKKQISLIGMAGLLTGWVGTGGAIRAMVLSAFNYSKYEFIFISSGIDLGGDVLRTVIYLFSGFLEYEHILYIPALGICAWIGSQIGKSLVKRIPQAFFERLVIVIIMAVGITTIIQFSTEY